MSQQIFHYKLDITESGGVSNELKNSFISFMKGCSYHLLVEEGGENRKEHYHLHAVVGSRYNCVKNFRKKEIKPVYQNCNRMESFTPVGVRTRTVKPVALNGALSYCYKDKRVLTVQGIELEKIPKWVDKKRSLVSARMKKFTVVRPRQFVFHVTKYIDTSGTMHPKCYQDVRNICEDMMAKDYLFYFNNKTRSHIAAVLQLFGTRNYALSHLDYVGNFAA